MKKFLISLIIISALLFVPTFVYAKGGNTMAYSLPTYGSTTPSTYYDPNVDYAALIKDAYSKGLDYSGLAASRDAKLAANPDPNAISTQDFINSLKPAGSDVPASNPIFTSQAAQDQVYAQSAPTSTNTNTSTDTVAISATPTAPVDTGPSAQETIAQLKAARLASQIARLDKAKNNSLSTLDQQQAGVEPAYYDKRNQVVAASDLGQMNFAQFMAGRGIKGNSAAMPEIYRNNALQTNIGKLNQQEQAQFDKINNDRTNINNNYQSDIAAANADVESQAMQDYINQMNADKQYELQKAGLTGSLNGTPTLAANSQTFNQNLATNQYNDSVANTNLQRQIDTLDAYSNDYQAEINKRQAVNPNDPLIPYLQAARQQKIKDQQTLADNKAAAESAATTAAAKEQWNNALEMWKQAGVAYPSFAAILGIPVGTKTAGYNVDGMKIAISQQNADANTKNAITNATNASKPDATKSTDALYNSTLSKATTWLAQGLTEEEIVSAINNTQGLDSQQKADIANALFP